MALTPESFDLDRPLALYASRRVVEAADCVLQYLSHFQQIHYFRLTDATRHCVNQFVNVALFLLSQDSFTLSAAQVSRFLELHGVLADVVAMSSFRTTDAHLKIVMRQPGNLARLLILYNVYNTSRLRRAALFSADPQLASRWYWMFLEKFNTGCASANGSAHLRQHVSELPEALALPALDGVTSAYFGVTYAHPDQEPALKRTLNRLVKRLRLLEGEIGNRPDPRRLAIISSFWRPGHSVYRALYPYLKTLVPDYRLTLVHLGAVRDDTDVSLFEDVVHCAYVDGRLRGLEDLRSNDFALAFFADVGMSLESILLANLRLAPVQVAAHGHPASTWGAEMDYWISGAETEALEGAERRYSERLVLIPGAGLVPIRPVYTLRRPLRDDSTVLVNCCWSAPKTNHAQLLLLAEIRRRATTPVRFRFFPGHTVQTGFIPYCRALIEALGEDGVEVHRSADYAGYMSSLEQAHLAVDAHPFGGYTTAIDALFLGHPLVARRGDRFFNRGAAFLLERVGLEELVTRSPEEYVRLSVRLIDDAAYRNSLRERLAQIDLEDRVFGHDDAPAFKRAIDHLLEIQPPGDGEDRSPIVIR